MSDRPHQVDGVHPELWRAGGGQWLAPSRVPALAHTPEQFSPERISDEERLIGSTVTAFVTAEVLPRLRQLEAQDWPAARHLVERCGQLGLLGIDAPIEHGGTALGTVAALVASERMALAASFRTTVAVQTNLVILPLTLFGSDAQRQQHLPALMAGRTIGAFCLTESGSGSDAFSAACTAERRDDGTFRLRGEKQWITNGGIADMFIVFATVPAQGLTAFLVDRSSPGVEPGPEERKMGLHGSSTTPVSFSDVTVEADRVLGGVGKGRDVARTALNYARLKLGAMCVGEAKNALADSCRYAAERHQFGKPIGHFGAVAHKLGGMVTRTYAVESIVARTGGMLDSGQRADPPRDGEARRAALDECAIESSIAKIAGSEMLEWVLSEAIQILGANGYSRDFPAERRFRDARPNRIFEGTNEINRLFLATALIKRSVWDEESGAPGTDDEHLDTPNGLAAALRLGDRLVHVARAVVGFTKRARPDGASHDQEVLVQIADIAADAYATQSVLIRASTALVRASTATRTAGAGSGRGLLHAAAATVVVHEAADRVRTAGRTVAAALLEGDALAEACATIDRLAPTPPVDCTALRRSLAQAAMERKGYPLEY